MRGIASGCVLMSLVLAGCGGSSNGSPNSAHGPTNPSNSPAAATSPEFPHERFAVHLTAPEGATLGFGSLWVAEHHSAQVARLDAQNGKLLATVAVGSQPFEPSLGSDALWVASNDRTVIRIDPNTNQPTKVATLENNPCGFHVTVGAIFWAVTCAEDPKPTTVLQGVSTRDGHTVARVDLGNVAATLGTDGHGLWAAEYNPPKLLQLDPVSGKTQRQVALHGCPLLWTGSVSASSIWVSQDTADTGINCTATGDAQLVDAQSLAVRSLPVGGPPLIATSDNEVWALAGASMTSTQQVLFRIDPSSLTAKPWTTTTLSGSPGGFADETGQVWVVAFDKDEAIAIGTQ